MKEEILAQVVPLVELTKHGILKAVEILQREAPEVVREILAWGIVSSLIPFVVGFIVFVLACWGVVHVCRHSDDFGDDTGAGIFFMSLVVAGLSFAIMCNASAWIKVLVAPRLYLIEYFSSLIK